MTPSAACPDPTIVSESEDAETRDCRYENFASDRRADLERATARLKRNCNRQATRGAGRIISSAFATTTG
jgi:hypothetical protein